ncbi:universal stress protein [Ekhidna sp.]|uniref:universal stress protein n=1 Tax=Ekhidna sp. TaxID=2608089 RepID=UPI0032985259
MKKILVPTDFSECAKNAGDVALQIAKKMKAEIHFLHYTSIPIDWVNMNDPKKMYPDVTKKVKQLEDELNGFVRLCEREGLSASFYIGYNESYQNIIDHIRIHKIDLVVMGSHGTSGFKETIIGSNAQRIIRLSTAPVIVVKPDTTAFNPTVMTIVSSFPSVHEKMEAGNIEAFAQLLNLAKEMKLTVRLLFINTPGVFTTSKALNQRITPYLELLKDEKYTVINAANLEDGINHYLEEHEEVLISMITHGETGLTRIIRGSQAESVVNHISNMILITKIQ